MVLSNNRCGCHLHEASLIVTPAPPPAVVPPLPRIPVSTDVISTRHGFGWTKTSAQVKIHRKACYMSCRSHLHDLYLNSLLLPKRIAARRRRYAKRHPFDVGLPGSYNNPFGLSLVYEQYE